MRSNRTNSVFFDSSISEGMSETEFLCRLFNLETGENCDKNGFESVPEKIKEKLVCLTKNDFDILVWHTKTIYPGFSNF